jgi:Protein of unknown function (DUF4254)
MNYYSDKLDTGLFDNLAVFAENANSIYKQAIDNYHFYNSVNQPVCNPYPENRFEALLYEKCWIDTVQWHVEDEIRDPYIEAGDALNLKRRIDALNQERTDRVEQIDNCLLVRFNSVKASPGALINTESPAWALDRLSILALKIYHMAQEVKREGVTGDHVKKCERKLSVLWEQRKDLSLSINQLLQDIARGMKYMKVYRQMKMYNDPSLNPVLYNAVKL